MKFSEKVRTLRKSLKLTQADVAKAIGVSVRTYLSYEQDGRYPRKREVYSKLAEVFHCDVNYLLTEDEGGFILQAGERYGTRAQRQAERLIDDFEGLFAGGELSEDDKDALMLAMQKIYWECKEDNKKYTPNKYKKDS